MKPESRDQTAVVRASNSVRSRRLKVWGGSILLLSFATQTFLYDDWTERDNELRTAILERSLADKSTLINEVLYFTADSSSTVLSRSELRSQKIAEAARKVYMSAVMPIAYSTLISPSEKSALLGNLRTHAQRVTDYDSYFNFLQVVNESTARYARSIVEQQVDLSRKRKMARRGYLALYVLGTILLLAGQRLE